VQTGGNYDILGTAPGPATNERAPVAAGRHIQAGTAVRMGRALRLRSPTVLGDDESTPAEMIENFRGCHSSSTSARRAGRSMYSAASAVIAGRITSV
jgi:hypothetical protein